MKITRHFFAVLVAVTALVTIAACSDDNNGGSSGGGSPQASQSEACDDLDVVRQDVEGVRQSLLNGDVAGAQDALEQGRDNAADLRESVRDAEPSDAASQSAADLVGAADGLETTLRQVGQGGGSIQGVLQELQIQLGAMVSSFNSLVTELGC